MGSVVSLLEIEFFKSIPLESWGWFDGKQSFGHANIIESFVVFINWFHANVIEVDGVAGAMTEQIFFLINCHLSLVAMTVRSI